MLKRDIVFVLLAFLMSACAPRPEPLPTATPLPTLPPTETPIWFPATATPTLLPIAEASPTPDMHPGLGALLLSDDFSSASLWATSQSDSATALIANGRITLSTDRAGLVVLSTRSEPVFGDFYAEITAISGLCEGEDEYGFVVRATSSGDQYRFALSCDGRAKVDRILAGSASRPAGWLQSPILPKLGPSTVRLAVWASGSQMRFFVDDAFLFSINDTVLYNGTVGVYIRARGEGALSVSFSDLQVLALEN